jgi:polyhydroxyalkanoate synthase
VRFVLTNGGHNAGIVSEPGHKGRSYQMLDMAADATPMAPEEWQQVAPRAEGSWWPAWSAWLLKQGSGQQVEARQPPQDPLLGAAPGAYVLVRYPD